MAVSFFELFPAVGENGTVIVETDEQDVRSPAQTITDVEWRGLATGKALLAVGTVVFFAGKFDATFNIHGDILRRRIASGVSVEMCLLVEWRSDPGR